MNFNKLRRIKKNKRGFIVGDLLFFGVIILVLAIMIIIGGNLTQEFDTAINDSSIGNEGKSLVTDYNLRFDGVFDWIFFFIFMMFGISIVASLFFLDSNPALFFIIIILFAFILLLIGIFSNVFENFTETGEEYSQRKDMPITDYLMDNMLMFVLIFGIIGVIILYAQIGRS